MVGMITPVWMIPTASMATVSIPTASMTTVAIPTADYYNKSLRRERRLNLFFWRGLCSCCACCAFRSLLCLLWVFRNYALLGRACYNFRSFLCLLQFQKLCFYQGVLAIVCLHLIVVTILASTASYSFLYFQ